MITLVIPDGFNKLFFKGNCQALNFQYNPKKNNSFDVRQTDFFAQTCKFGLVL